jgi:hypothetical protein
MSIRKEIVNPFEKESIIRVLLKETSKDHGVQKHCDDLIEFLKTNGYEVKDKDAFLQKYIQYLATGGKSDLGVP